MNAQRRRVGRPLAESHERFRAIVESAIGQHSLGLLAEEDHPEYLNKRGLQSILVEVAERNGIEHRFVDPCTSERKVIGYHSQEFIIETHGIGYIAAMAHEIVCQFPKREGFWLNKLRPALDRDVLFVCGFGHLESFRKRLHDEGLEGTVLADRVGIDDHGRDFDRRVRVYIAEHPSEFSNPSCFCHR